MSQSETEISWDHATGAFRVEADPLWRGVALHMPSSVSLKKVGARSARVIDAHIFYRVRRGMLTSVGPCFFVGSKRVSTVSDKDILVSAKGVTLPEMVDEVRVHYRLSLSDLQIPFKTGTHEIRYSTGPSSNFIKFSVEP